MVLLIFACGAVLGFMVGYYYARFKNVRPQKTPKSGRKAADDDEPLDARAAADYRSLAARVNYLARERPDLLYDSKECSRAISNPTGGDLARLRRIDRFLSAPPKGEPKVFYGLSESPKEWLARQTAEGGNVSSSGPAAPAKVVITKTGQCFHLPSCQTIRTGMIKQTYRYFDRCQICFGM